MNNNDFNSIMWYNITMTQGLMFDNNRSVIPGSEIVTGALASIEHADYTHPLFDPDDLHNSIGSPSFTHLFTAPYTIITSLFQLVHGAATLNKKEMYQAATNMVQTPFALGASISNTLQIAATLDLITNISLSALIPVTAILGIIYLVAQTGYEAYELYNSYQFNKSLDIKFYQKLVATIGENSPDRATAFINAHAGEFQTHFNERNDPIKYLKTEQKAFLKKTLLHVQSKYGGISKEQSSKVMRKYTSKIDAASKDLTPEEKAHFPSLIKVIDTFGHTFTKQTQFLYQNNDITSQDLVDYVDRFKALLQHESIGANLDGLSRIITKAGEDRAKLHQVISIIYAKMLEGIPERATVKDLPIERVDSFNKEILETNRAALEKIEKIRKGNAEALSRRVRPWMAREFFAEVTTTLKNLEENSDVLGAENLYINLVSQAEKMRLYHTISLVMLAVTTVFVGLTMTHMPALAIYALSVLQTAYFFGRNVIAYGWLDERGNHYNLKHVFPKWLQQLYTRYWNGDTSAFKITNDDLINDEVRKIIRKGREEYAHENGLVKTNGFNPLTPANRD